MALRLLKALATFLVFALLVFLASWRYLRPFAVALMTTVTIPTYGISFLFAAKLAPYRRWGISYLVFVGVTYLLAGIVGLLPHWDLIEATIWQSLISPYPVLTLLDRCVLHFPCTISRIPFEILPHSDHHLFSAAVVVVSSIAIVAAFAMARTNKVANWIWLALVGISVLVTLAYVVAGLAYRDASEATSAVCWAASYLAAYGMARKGADIQT